MKLSDHVFRCAAKDLLHLFPLAGGGAMHLNDSPPQSCVKVEGAA
jgi:hypothetical protein